MLDLVNLAKNVLIEGTPSDEASPVLASNVALSFWGGIDPLTGVITDQSHPLVGESVTDKILCLPSGRGSCTASQVLLELILNEKAPRAIVLRDVDPLVCVGAIVAEEVFGKKELSIFQALDFQCLLEESHREGGLSLKVSEVMALSKARELEWTEQEKAWLRNASTEAERMALRVIYRYARITGTNDYVSVSSAHIDGCTYIGPGGLDFVQRLVQAGGKVKIPTTLNSISTDRRKWKMLAVPEEYANAANALADAYLNLNCQPTYTCAPYLLLEKDQTTLGKDWVWGESNAVVYANSVLGARTNKIADYLDICGALAGIVPNEGMHKSENRKPSIILDARELAEDSVLSDALYPTLGHVCGSLSDGKIPLLIGLEDWKVSPDDLKAFCAAFGTTGSSPLIHIAGITPEARDKDIVDAWTSESDESTEVVAVTSKGLLETFHLLDRDQNSSKIDLIALGNPHLSVTECEKLADLVRQQEDAEKHPNVRVIACISRAVQEAAAKHILPLKEFGVEFVNDTCWCMLLDPPIIPMSKQATILTNSGKYSHYGPGLVQRKFRFGSLGDCIRSATTGQYSSILNPQASMRRSFHSGSGSTRASLGRLRPEYRAAGYRGVFGMLLRKKRLFR